MLHQNQSKKVNHLKLAIIFPVLAAFLMAFNTTTTYKTIPTVTATPDGKEIGSFIIEKNTTNAELEAIKSALKDNAIDFSYTVVRDLNGHIISAALSAVTSKNQDVFTVDFNTNTEGRPIGEILVKYNKENEFLIIKPVATNIEEAKTYSSKPQEIQEEIQVTNITLEINKYSKEDILKKDTKFLAERGVDISFKGIKRNSKGEITAIKVFYDNGNADKGNYQQKKTGGISPFKIAVDFKDDQKPSIIILSAEDKKNTKTHTISSTVWVSDDEDNEVIEIRKNKRGNTLWVSNDTTITKVIEFKKDGANDVIILNGNEISIDSLAEHGAMEKMLSKTPKHEVTELRVLEVNYDNGYNKKIELLPEESDSTRKKYIVIETDSIGANSHQLKKDKNVFILKNSDDNIVNEAKRETNGVFIMDTNGKEPLIIIDGKEVTEKGIMEKLDPDSIATIEVLKDKAAEKKYGEKGANGVIEITTKKK